MRWTLRHDTETTELRLVARDIWDGKHELTEWRVLASDSGNVAKRFPELDGRTVYSDGAGGGFYITHGEYQRHEYLRVEDLPVVVEKLPCPRSENRRRKCPHCAEWEAGR